VEKPVEDDDLKAEGPVVDTKLKPKKGVDRLWYNAVIPVLAVVIVTFVSLIVDGYYSLEEGQPESIKNMFSEADSYNALMYGSFAGLVVPLVLLKAQKIMEPNETIHIWIDSMKDLVEPLLVLIHAWAIGDVITDLGLSLWIAQELGDSLNEVSLPSITFLASAFIAFCTGTSWGTMAIMIPIVLNLADEVGGGDLDLITKALGTVLAGAVFGDHCSPISVKCFPDHLWSQQVLKLPLY
jgi:Na+/H+ antiporter NhaC